MPSVNLCIRTIQRFQYVPDIPLMIPRVTLNLGFQPTSTKELLNANTELAATEETWKEWSGLICYNISKGSESNLIIESMTHV